MSNCAIPAKLNTGFIMWTSPNETQPLDLNDIHYLDDFGLLKASKCLKV